MDAFFSANEFTDTSTQVPVNSFDEPLKHNFCVFFTHLSKPKFQKCVI